MLALASRPSIPSLTRYEAAWNFIVDRFNVIVLVTGAGVPHILKILYRFQVDVNGDKATPLYKFLKSSKGGLFGDGIKWNFAKFLVDKEGNVVNRYAPTTSPLGIEVQNKSCHYFAKFQVNLILLVD